MLAGRIVLAIAGAVLLLSSSSLPASEPNGFAIVSFEWIDDPDATLHAGERVLRVRVKPTVEAKSVRLGYRSPEDITVSARGDVEREPDSEGAPRLSLGDLAPHQSRTVEFVVQAPETKAGVAVFSVSGELAAGKTFREAFGWTVGTPAAPAIRHGAAEFPARIEPE
jgi:hypothetical protein